MIMQYVAFALSAFGIMAWLAGFLGFVLLPLIPKVTGELQGFTRLPLRLGMGMLGRAGILVSEHNDILLKPMSFDDLGVETMSVGNEQKEFEDPDGALHYFMGIPFALADEVHGILFDPRHAAVGKRKADDHEQNEWLRYATETEWDNYGVSYWYKGVYEFAKDTYELVNLSHVRQLVDGGERAEYPQRVQKEYEQSRQPFAESVSSWRVLVIVVALLGPFVVIWFMKSYLSAPDASLSFGVLAMLFSGAGLADMDVNAKRVATIIAVAGIPVVALLAIALLFNPVLAGFVLLTVALGFAFVPVLSFAFRPSTLLSDFLAGILWKLGMLGFDRPVFEWRRRKYVLREHRKLSDTAIQPTWYSLGGKQVGFTFDPSADSWGAEVVDAGKLEAKQELATDGGGDTNVPAGYAKTPDITRADGKYAAFVPKRLNPDDHYYLDTAIAKARFTDAANGEKSLNRLLWAKENKTESNGMADSHMIYAVAGSSIFSFVLSVVLFLL